MTVQMAPTICIPIEKVSNSFISQKSKRSGAYCNNGFPFIFFSLINNCSCTLKWFEVIIWHMSAYS